MTEEKRQTQEIQELKALPADELLDTTFAPRGTLIDGLIGQGIYIFADVPKVGKSWMVLWLADKVSKDEPIWGLKTEKRDGFEQQLVSFLTSHSNVGLVIIDTLQCIRKTGSSDPFTDGSEGA